jgi:hypothetical protein
LTEGLRRENVGLHKNDRQQLRLGLTNIHDSQRLSPAAYFQVGSTNCSVGKHLTVNPNGRMFVIVNDRNSAPQIVLTPLEVV